MDQLAEKIQQIAANHSFINGVGLANTMQQQSTHRSTVRLDSATLTMIEKRLGYTFQDLSLLSQAFIHPSYYHENPSKTSSHYERLEFLGDSALGLIVSNYLYHSYPRHEGGELRDMCTLLVDTPACSDYLQQLELEKYIQLGVKELKSKGQERASIEGDVFEAIIGAIYLDGGIQSAEQVFLSHCKSNLIELIACRPRNWKGELQTPTSQIDATSSRPPPISPSAPSAPPLPSSLDEPPPSYEQVINDQPFSSGSSSSTASSQPVSHSQQLQPPFITFLELGIDEVKEMAKQEGGGMTGTVELVLKMDELKLMLMEHKSMLIERKDHPLVLQSVENLRNVLSSTKRLERFLRDAKFQKLIQISLNEIDVASSQLLHAIASPKVSEPVKKMERGGEEEFLNADAADIIPPIIHEDKNAHPPISDANQSIPTVAAKPININGEKKQGLICLSPIIISDPLIHPVAEPLVTPAVAPLALNDPTLVTGHGWSLRLADSVDCLDTEQRWRLGEIVSADSANVLVHYVGWGEKWDAWFQRDDKSLQPPRTKTDGWTGPDRVKQHSTSFSSSPSTSPSPPGGKPVPPPPEPTITLNVHFPGTKHKTPQPLFLNQQLISLIHHPQMQSFKLTPQQQAQIKFFVSIASNEWEEVDPRATPQQLNLKDGTHMGIKLK